MILKHLINYKFLNFVELAHFHLIAYFLFIFLINYKCRFKLIFPHSMLLFIFIIFHYLCLKEYSIFLILNLEFLVFIFIDLNLVFLDCFL